jgi:hypothetical protein
VFVYAHKSNNDKHPSPVQLSLHTKPTNQTNAYKTK